MNTARYVAIAAVLMVSAGQAPADERLVEYYGCDECHRDAADAIAPAFPAIAERYQDDPDARGALIEVIRNGGKGNWTGLSGGVPMPPYSASISRAEIEQIVDWVLSL